MLAQLDEVDWRSLRHAYGPATDVPELLRALAASEDEHARDQVLGELYGNIFHQGTRYTATPHAIRFLVEIAAAPGRSDVLGLLVHCVAGYFSTASGPRTARGPIWSSVPPTPMADYGETLQILEACELAAEPAVPLCLRLVEHGDERERVAALHLLAALSRFAERYEVVPRLQAALAAGPTSRVRAMLAFALTHVLPVGRSAELDAIATGDADELTRAIATMGCVRRGHAPPQGPAALLAWLDDDALAMRYGSLPVAGADLAGDIAAVMTALDRGALRAALPQLCGRLRTAADFGAVGVLEAALAAAFGSDDVPAVLAPDQRMLLETLAHNQAFWSIGNAVMYLLDRGLPSARDEMAAYLGIQVETDPVEEARIQARHAAPFGEEEAIAGWERVLAMAPDDAEAHVQLGTLCFAREDLARAATHLTRALAAPPPGRAGQLWCLLGTAQLALDDVEGALHAFAQAEPHLQGSMREQARGNRVALLQQLGRMDEALALRAETPPVTSADYYHLGLAQVKAGQYAACIESIERVLEDEPEHALAHYTIACAYALSGDRENALTSIDRALGCDPELAPAIAEDPDFASLRSDPLFVALVSSD